MIILKAENISKQYRLGTVGTGTLKHDFNRFWHRIRGKEDPYLKIGAVNDRSSKTKEEYVWALNDINFEVQEGEVLGIIGKNGAGKSTLLKILSRVTSPTTGVIKTKGRIASLLEVGTGFHPELTGRENIFLNGAILGMTKAEITAKVDEIIDFSGCEMYIDTPVKRYSSGMTVRLAFAVAAHLEPDILVVDEVLAVGDAEFQKKAIGKMQDISKGQGRTVLFVSHNMASVQQLCTKGIVLVNGVIAFSGKIDDCVDFYLNDTAVHENNMYINSAESGTTDFLEIKVLKNGAPSSFFRFDEAIELNFKISHHFDDRDVALSFAVIDQKNRKIFSSEIYLDNNLSGLVTKSFNVEIPKSVLVPNYYNVTVALHIPIVRQIRYLDSVVSFGIEETGSDFAKYGKNDIGCVFLSCVWTEIT